MVDFSRHMPIPLSGISHKSQIQSPKSTVAPDKALKAAQDFEIAFASHLIQQIFSGNDTGLFGGGKTEVMFRSLWAEKIAESMVGTFGVAESVYPVLMKNAQVEKKDIPDV